MLTEVNREFQIDCDTINYIDQWQFELPEDIHLCWFSQCFYTAPELVNNTNNYYTDNAINVSNSTNYITSTIISNTGSGNITVGAQKMIYELLLRRKLDH